MATYVSQENIPVDNCGFCMVTLKDPNQAVVKLECGHMFHNDCLVEYCKHSHNITPNNPELNCPICRQEMDPMDCITYWAFKERSWSPESINQLPQDVQNIYNNQHAGKRKNKKIKKTLKKKRYTKKNKKTRRKLLKKHK